MSNYGLAWKGSKSFIADWVVDNLPSADCFVDLFFGGGAITHCAMTRNKYKTYIANDLLDMSEYYAPDDFVCVAEKEKIVLYKNSGGGRPKATERLFVVKGFENKFKNKNGFLF